MPEKQMGFIPACKAFFGFAPGQGLRDFMLECKKLTPEDRAEITEGLRQNGYDVREEVASA